MISKKNCLKFAVSILILFAGNEYCVKPVLIANGELEIKFIEITLTEKPKKVEGNITGSLKKTYHYELKSKDLPKIKFLITGSSYDQCHPGITTNITKGSLIKIGISSKNYFEKIIRKEKNRDGKPTTINVFELIQVLGEMEVIYLSKEVELERREGWKRFTYPFAIFCYLLILIIFFEKELKLS